MSPCLSTHPPARKAARQVAHIRASRCDPCGTAVRLVRLRCVESPGRRPDRGGTCAAVGSCRPGGQPGRRPSCTSPCRRLALLTCPRRHQDEEVPALFGIAQDGCGSAPGAPTAASGRAATGWRSVAGQRARLHCSARDAARCGGCAPVSLRTICRKADLGEEWTPRELRELSPRLYLATAAPRTLWLSRGPIAPQPQPLLPTGTGRMDWQMKKGSVPPAQGPGRV
jgi:hypothetical protein